MPITDPADPNTPPQVTWTPEQLDTWLKIQQQQAATANIGAEAAARSKYGPELQYAPVKETYVDAQGNEVPKGTEGATQKIGLRDEYKLSDPDNYISALMQQQQVGESKNIDDATKASAQAQAQARSGAAMRGGLRSGASDQLNRNSMQDLMKTRQNVTQQGSGDRAALASKGAELKRGTEAYNLENLLKGGEYTNKFELDKYKQQMASKAASENANATRAASENQGKK